MERLEFAQIPILTKSDFLEKPQLERGGTMGGCPPRRKLARMLVMHQSELDNDEATVSAATGRQLVAVLSYSCRP